jgi:hypothetical protein
MTLPSVKVVAVAATLALGVNSGTALAASTGVNSGNAPDQGNCFGDFVNQGSLGYAVSNFGTPSPSGLGQSIGKDERGCRD